MDEKQLIEGCVRGDLWAQKRMYELHAPSMMSICQRYVCNRDTARDLMHDGFVKLFAKIHSYSGAGSFNGWMKRVFVTTALEHLRRNDVLRQTVDINDVDYPSDEYDISEFEHLTVDDLLACIANLSEGYRTIFNLHAIEGFTHVEIAKALKINEGTVRSQYAKARQLLQKMVMDKVKSIEY